MTPISRPRIRCWLTCALALAFTAKVDAEVFRSVEPDGTPEYSQHREPGKSTAEKLKIDVQKSAAQPAAKEPIVHEGAGTVTVRVPAKPKDQKPKYTKEQLAQLKDGCEKAKAAIAQLQGENGVRPYRLQYIDKNGERAYLTEELIKEHLADAKKKAKDYCIQQP